MIYDIIYCIIFGQGCGQFGVPGARPPPLTATASLSAGQITLTKGRVHLIL